MVAHRAKGLGAMDLNKEFHPLFMPKKEDEDGDYAPETFARIEVTRLEANGPLRATERAETRCMRFYVPSELHSPERFQELFGGGSYSLVARRANGTFYRETWFNSGGDSKPMPDSRPGEAAGPAPAVAPVVTPLSAKYPGLDPMGAIMLEQAAEARRESEIARREAADRDREARRDADARSERTITLVVGAIAALAPVIFKDKPQESLSEALKGLAALTEAKHPAPPARGIKDLLEDQKLLKEVTTQPKTEESTKELVECVGELGLKALAMMGNATAPATAATVAKPNPVLAAVEALQKAG